MEKTSKNKLEDVTRLLALQKIRDVKDLESYKLSVCHPHSAGIDLGSREIYVAIDPRIAAEMGIPIVHVFNTFTSGLQDCRKLLMNCGIQTVAMESTSIYWTTIYSILVSAGFEVCLVNPKKFRMVPGRKTDVLDCQWLQTLHLYGLLRGSFHPEEKIACFYDIAKVCFNILCKGLQYGHT
ncbi:IS110 family transposase, partial [Bacteroides ovatus]|uniref:IS110 family transposase n=1 Tax=Bacteroides ovatus TaxID=28116 RepID=UPI00232C4363